MARPITPTPKLNRKDTVDFVTRLWENQDKKEVICLADSVRMARERKRQQ